jgi:hypothetical protein
MRGARALVSLLFVGLVLAGCAERDEAGGGDDAVVDDGLVPDLGRPVLPASIAFSPEILLGEIQGGAEPSIAVAPDGSVVYVVTPLALWRSFDDGVSWEPVGTPICPFGAPACPGLEEYDPPVRGGGDADIHVDPSGRAHWLGLFDGDNAIPYQYSDDNGTTWTPVVDLAGEDSGDREWITGRADGTLFAAWRNSPSDGERDPTIVVRSSYDGGETWTPAVDIAPSTRQGGIAVDPSSDALAIAYDLNGPTHVARSFDEGLTWNSTLVLNDPVLGHVFPVTAYDANGTLYLVVSHDRDGSQVPGTIDITGASRPMETPNIYLMVSHDKGATWSPPLQVNEPGTTGWFPWIAAGSKGRLVITWYQNDEGLPRQVGGEVQVMAAISVDADYPDPTFALTRVNSSPVHTGPECRETPGACTRSLLDFFEVAIHPDGYPIVTWAQDDYQIPRSRVMVARMTSGPDLFEGM